MKIIKYRRNCLGTLSITLQAPQMKKPAEFSVYPIHSGNENQPIRLQSEHYWAELNSESGVIEFSSRISSYATSWHFQFDKSRKATKTYQIDKEMLAEILEKIGETSGEKVGNNAIGMVTDNSGASKFVIR